MLAYKAAYKVIEDVYIGEVLDFPGTVASGKDLDEVRASLADALLDMAETNLVKGEALPLPCPSRSDPDADLEEPIYINLQTGHQFSVNVTSGAS